MFSLNGKVALITGAASGIGESIARAFSDAGAFVYVADRDPRGRTVAESLPASSFLSVDVAQEDEVRAAATQVEAEHGRCDILVNNAGIGHVGTVLTTTGADLDRLIAVNVKGVLHWSQAFLPGMIERRQGSIINLASIGGIVGIRDRFGYCATKFAVVGMTRCMALDHADSGVRINCICPGRVETPFVAARLAEYPDPDRARAEMSATQALGRMGTPDEIAAAALYLASDEAAFVTGSALIIDGGWSAGK
ncbi:MAG: glucose 1-dehydrogenase [Capsulimonadales bacterium]|nr:glucose 1-dehydrogenase [Capsulimonadales bacterium]